MTTAKTTRKPASKPPRKAAVQVTRTPTVKSTRTATPKPVVRATARRARPSLAEVPDITARTAPIPEYPAPTRPAVPPWTRPGAPQASSASRLQTIRLTSAAAEGTAVVSSVRGSRLAAWLRR